MIWEISDVEQCELNELKLFPKATCYLNSLGSASRRKEWMAWHYLVRKFIGEYEVNYDRNGAPYLIGRSGFISISHCDNYTGLLYDEKNPCGIDIENSSRKIDKITPRFLRSDENILLHEEKLPELLIWCAKETLYKFYGEKGIDFLNDIKIDKINITENQMSGIIKDRYKTLDYIITPEYTAVSTSFDK
ncbi:MAG: 4'-phosphopantetheinyl transferase superfamily protein [Rikenellaceae bacterium]|nr:4'-phosphopantetheinyl transferase superfamily protein [Rikenellaceae bacterium]